MELRYRRGVFRNVKCKWRNFDVLFAINLWFRDCVFFLSFLSTLPLSGHDVLECGCASDRLALHTAITCDSKKGIGEVEWKGKDDNDRILWKLH